MYVWKPRSKALNSKLNCVELKLWCGYTKCFVSTLHLMQSHPASDAFPKSGDKPPNNNRL